MSLLEQITSDMKSALKAKNNAALSTLRLLVAAIKNKKIDVQHELTDTEIQSVVTTQIKQLKDSIVSFEQARRADMVQAAQAEIVVLQAYMPQQMSVEELTTLVKDAIAQTGATSASDLGRVMGVSVKMAQGKADGSRMKEIAMQLLPVILLLLTGSFTPTDAVQAAIPINGHSFGTGLYFIELGLRVFRVLILWFGVVGISMVLQGGFQYMIASMRDNEHKHAWGKISHGLFASAIVAGLFTLSTIVLQEI